MKKALCNTIIFKVDAIGTDISSTIGVTNRAQYDTDS